MSNTNTYDKSFPVSWEEIHRNSKALAWRLSELKPYKGIIAVTRGGLVPAAIVARELDIRLIDTFCVLSYSEKTKGDIKVIKESSVANNGEGWLIVDDLVDTGETIKAIRTIIRKLIVIIKRNKLKFDLLKSASSSRTSNDLYCCIDD